MRRGSLLVAVALLGSAAASAAAGDGDLPPQPALLPSLVFPGDRPAVGEPVRVEPGAWSGRPSAFAYRWERCGVVPPCVTVPGALGPVYVPGAADAGGALRAVVSAEGPGGRTEAATATSPPVAFPSAAGAGPVAPWMTPGGAGVRLGGLPRRLSHRLGRLAVVRGRLRDAAGGGPATGREVTLRDPWGRLMDTAVSAGDGRFRLAARVWRPGPWSVSAAGISSVVGVRVRPDVRLTAATVLVRPPAVVALRGRLLPHVAGKIVQMQYLDPTRGWRLWKQTRTDTAGRFALRRVLQPNPLAPRFTLRVRAVVPVDVGWPFAPAGTRVVAVRVR